MISSTLFLSFLFSLVLTFLFLFKNENIFSLIRKRFSDLCAIHDLFRRIHAVSFVTTFGVCLTFRVRVFFFSEKWKIEKKKKTSISLVVSNKDSYELGSHRGSIGS